MTEKQEYHIGDLDMAPFFNPQGWEVLGQPLPKLLEAYCGGKGTFQELLRACEVTQLWHLPRVVENIISRTGGSVHPSVQIEEGVEISGNVIIEENTRILAGARLKGNIFIGAGSFIGNNALVRGTVSLGRRSIVAYSTDIKDVIAGWENGFGPLNFFGNSYVGSQCFFGGVVRVSNFRLDNRTVSIKIKEKLIDTGLGRFGCVIGDRVSLGIGCIILPGRLVEHDTVCGPQVIIERNLPGNRTYRLKQAIEEIT